MPDHWDYEWKRLAAGVYLHRWLPRLAIVRSELTASLWIRDDLTSPEWCFLASEIIGTAVRSWDEALAAGIRIEDVVVFADRDG